MFELDTDSQEEEQELVDLRTKQKPLAMTITAFFTQTTNGHISKVGGSLQNSLKPNQIIKNYKVFGIM